MVGDMTGRSLLEVEECMEPACWIRVVTVEVEWTVTTQNQLISE
jgi:hypothetical protein